MNTEQKAKAYDKAIEKARNIYGASESRDILTTLRTVFPELAESEDERIKENLIGYIKGISKNEVCEETKNSWIAWLEKQGEQKSNG